MTIASSAINSIRRSHASSAAREINDIGFHALVNAALGRYTALWKGGKAPTFNCKDRAPEELCNLTPEDSLMQFGRLNASGEHAQEILRGVWRNQHGMVECPSGINYSPEMEG